MKKTASLNSNEKGFTSLVVAFILILVLSLVTLGFAQLARREQQNALDKQLADQAFYAAESGVNDLSAEKAVLQANAGSINPATCLPASYLPGSQPNIISSSNDVTIACALVNPNPSQLVGNEAGPGGENFIFSTANPISQLAFSWGSYSGSNNPLTPTCSNTPNCLPSVTQWTSSQSPSVVQLSITPLGNGNVTRDQLIQQTFTTYIYPSNNVQVTDSYSNNTSSPPSCGTNIPTPPGYGAINYSQDQGTYADDDSACNGLIVGADYDSAADDSYPFSVTINNLPNEGANGWWLVHVSYPYAGIKECLQATEVADCGESTVNLMGSEMLVDVTGKAKDVEKRIVEYIPYSSQNGITNTPNYAIDAGSVCKQFQTNPANPAVNELYPVTSVLENTNYTPVTSDPDCIFGP